VFLPADRPPGEVISFATLPHLTPSPQDLCLFLHYTLRALPPESTSISSDALASFVPPIVVAMPVQVEPLQLEDVDTAFEISLKAFKNDAHTLFKMHEKGSNDLGSEMLPAENIRGMVGKDKYRIWKAVVGGQIAGFTIWGLWNWDGEKRGVSLVCLFGWSAWVCWVASSAAFAWSARAVRSLVRDSHGGCLPRGCAGLSPSLRSCL